MRRRPRCKNVPEAAARIEALEDRVATLLQSQVATSAQIAALAARVRLLESAQPAAFVA